MPPRFVRQPGTLKLVLVEVPRERPIKDDPPPLPLMSGETLALARTVRSLAARLRLDAWRSRQTIRATINQKPRRTPDPSSDVPKEDVLRARQQTGLSQRDVAKELGLARGTVANAESGRGHVPQRLGDWALQVLRAEEGKR